MSQLFCWCHTETICLILHQHLISLKLTLKCFTRPAVHGDVGCGQKKNFRLVWQCHQLLSRFLTKGHLPGVSSQSHWSLMISVTMKSSQGLCTDLLEFALPCKTSVRRSSDEGIMRPVIASNGVLYLQMRSVESHSTKEERRIFSFLFSSLWDPL